MVRDDPSLETIYGERPRVFRRGETLRARDGAPRLLRPFCLPKRLRLDVLRTRQDELYAFRVQLLE